ncbi:hypothetical protein ACN47E_001996 [Coniothyrium glycines]
MAKKKFFLFAQPMLAKGREDTLLGVAFESPAEGTLASFTPQGLDQVEESNPSAFESIVKTLQNLNPLAQTEVEHTPPATPNNGTEPETSHENLLYRSACAWPRDLVKKVYPPAPTSAVGVEFIKNRVNDDAATTRILHVISLRLGFKRQQLDDLIIPVLRRHSMPDPWGTIYELLAEKEYRDRFIDLCNRQQTRSSRKALYVATGIIACEGVTKERLNQDEKELSGNVGDPSNTVPVNIGGKMRRLKGDTVKGEYSQAILLAMSYRKVEYECIMPTSKPWYSYSRWKNGSENHVKKSSHEPDAGYKRDGDDGRVDAFWIPKFDQEGDTANFLGPDDATEEAGILQDVEFSDTEGGAEGNDDEVVKRDCIKA